MELHSLGGYRLLRAVPARNTVCRHYLAQLDGPADADQARRAPPFLVKLLTPGDGPEQSALEAQFDHEARLLHAFSHPGIPTLHAHGTQDGVRYMVMDYIDGVDLATLLGHRQHETRSLSKEMAVYILGQLADALRHVHTFEIALDPDPEDPDTPETKKKKRGDEDFMGLDCLHRDICPANVALSREGDVVLIDFGAASSRWLPPEQTGSQAGTRAYMAPERVIGGGAATVQTDLFSLAVVLWEILRGQRCLWAEDELRTMEAIARFDISHASRRVSGLSPRLSEVLRKNLDRDPARRYASARQVLQRLAQATEAAAAERARFELAALVNEAFDATNGAGTGSPG